MLFLQKAKISLLLTNIALFLKHKVYQLQIDSTCFKLLLNNFPSFINTGKLEMCACAQNWKEHKN